MTTRTLADLITLRHVTTFTLPLRFIDVPVRVLADDPDVWMGLSRYYAPWVAGDVDPGAPTVTLLHGDVSVNGDFHDVVRADGKKVKEAVRDIGSGRLIFKRQTGVVMAMWPDRAVAAGDLRKNLNQAINLVNNVYANAVMARGYRLFHASAVTRAGRAVVLAGVPGAGKSTASLHFVEAGWRFLSNDRVLAKVAPDGGIDLRGYPKQPRVNPGTLVHHPRLASQLKPDDRQALLSMPSDKLWQLERKSDVDLDALYGRGTMHLSARMALFVVLRWRPGLAEPPAFRRLPSDELGDVVPLVSKDLGVFGVGAAATVTASDTAPYEDLLRRVPVHEASGGMDLAALELLASVRVAVAGQ
jgi:HprK-related kinase B